MTAIKKNLEVDLEEIEKKIYLLENKYLLESKNSQFNLKKKSFSKSGKTSRSNLSRFRKISENERLFSLSSCTSLANKKLKREIEYSNKLEREHENIKNFVNLRNLRSTSPCFVEKKSLKHVFGKKKIGKKSSVRNLDVFEKRGFFGIKTRKMNKK